MCNYWIIGWLLLFWIFTIYLYIYLTLFCYFLFLKIFIEKEYFRGSPPGCDWLQGFWFLGELGPLRTSPSHPKSFYFSFPNWNRLIFPHSLMELKLCHTPILTFSSQRFFFFFLFLLLLLLLLLLNCFTSRLCLDSWISKQRSFKKHFRMLTEVLSLSQSFTCVWLLRKLRVFFFVIFFSQ